MSNAIIKFEATRNLVAGITEGDELSYAVTLTAFDPAPDVKKKTSRPMDGGPEESSLFYIGKTYSLAIAEEGTVTLPDTTTTPLTNEYMEMYFYSTAASEEHTITSLDAGNAELDIQMMGTWSPQRRSAAWVNQFAYNYRVRVI